MWKKDIDIREVKEIRVRPNVYFGVGAIAKIADIVKQLKERGVAKVVVVSGRGAYKSTGAWAHVEAALKANDVGYINYDKVTPNPTTHQVDEAVARARAFGATAVIAIGGGSPIDAGKSAAVLLKYPGKTCNDLYEFAFAPTEAAPVVAINLTHGTGSETNRFAVVTIPEKDFKPAIAYDCLYPFASIDDPGLMTGLSPDQTRYVSIDAVNHVVEAATAKTCSPFSISLAKETIRLVVEFLPNALAKPDDLEARYYLTYASLLAGVSFDNGLLHYTHALEHPLSAVKPDLTHGLGLAMLLPAVVKHIYAEKQATLADIFEPIVKGKNLTAEAFAKQVEAWLFKMGATAKLVDEGFTEADVAKLTDLAFSTPSLGLLLSLAPNKSTREVVAAIYRESLTPYTVKA
jgi:alcohol dehydrogenase